MAIFLFVFFLIVFILMLAGSRILKKIKETKKPSKKLPTARNSVIAMRRDASASSIASVRNPSNRATKTPVVTPALRMLLAPRVLRGFAPLSPNLPLSPRSKKTPVAHKRQRAKPSSTTITRRAKTRRSSTTPTANT